MSVPRHLHPACVRRLSARIAGLVGCAGLLAAGGCASSAGNAGPLPEPLWFAEREAEFQGREFPDLAAIPDQPTDLRTPAEWTAFADDLGRSGEQTAAEVARFDAGRDPNPTAWAPPAREAIARALAEDWE